MTASVSQWKAWGMLKNEVIHQRRYYTRAQAMQEITEYIEILYNRQRKQARLGYLSPAAFTQRYYEKQLTAYNNSVGLHYANRPHDDKELGSKNHGLTSGASTYTARAGESANELFGFNPK